MLLTEATLASVLVQVTLGSVASFGRTVAVSVSLAAISSFSVSLLMETELTSTGGVGGVAGATTVTLQSAVSPLADLAVTVAVPTETALMTPSATVATALLEVDQVTVWSVASDGLIRART